ncbi:MAG: HAD hydrolase-like protein [Actinobacteria bacterium]|nr:HAD hydrolase-like protein [Actinomycetota bacterium]
MAIRGVLFDLGDTLVTQEALLGSVSNRLGALAVLEVVRPLMDAPPTPGQLAEGLGEGLHEALAEAYRTSAAMPDARDVFRRVFDAFEWAPSLEQIDRLLPLYFKPHYDAMRALPGAVETLATLRRDGLRVAILANLIYGEPLLVRRLQTLGLLEHADALILSSESGWLKPHPAPFRDAQARFGLQAAELVMVGDDWDVDVRTPQRLGLRAIWRPRPGTTLPDHVRPDGIVHELRDVPAVVLAIRAAASPA